MKRQDQYEKSARIFILGVIGIIIIILTLLVRKVNAQTKEGYLIVTQTTLPKKTNVFRVTNCAVADSIVYNHFGNSVKGFSTIEALKSSPYYIHQRLNFSVYVERKKIVRTKNGKNKYRKYRK